MLFTKREAVAALEVSGAEAAGFLNDLLTAQIATLEIGAARAACLLTPQGRILFDMLVFKPEADRFWLQLPADELGAFQKRLMMYRLRRPVEIAALEGWQSGLVFNPDGTVLDKPSANAVLDPRDGALGWHIVQPSGDLDVVADSKSVPEADWHQLRIKRNVPEGPVDLVRNRGLMLEAGLDNLDAVDFSKGCYIGQEVTARTHYRGLVKRRIIPVFAKTDGASSGGLTINMDVSRQDTVIGQILSCTDDGTSALASLRLDAVKAHLDGAPLSAGGIEVNAIYPEHLPPLKFPE